MTLTHYIYCIFILLILNAWPVESDKSHLKNCSNHSQSCTKRFSANASEGECKLLAYRGLECSSKKFVASSSSHSLGKVRLKVYSHVEIESHAAFNISLTNIKWTVFRFRFSMLENNITFCREFVLSPTYHAEEMFYDCLSKPSTYPGSSCVFEYHTEDENKNIEIRKFVHKIPSSSDIESTSPLQNFSPFLYVDITDRPSLTARWQQAPYNDLKYRIEVYKEDADAGKILEHSADVDGKDDNDDELSYTYNVFPSWGNFYIEVHVLSSNCTDNLCGVSTSPVVEIDGAFTEILLVGVVGCVVLIPLFLFVIFMWKRKNQPPSTDVKMPVVLIIHTPSRASHLKAVIALTEYLKNHCFIEALLDQLDVQYTKTKDPWTWCNNAFGQADFVMIVSSPPKCCNEEGIFRNMDLVALRFLKEKFSSGSSKPRFFSVMLPYCIQKDIPDEARNLRAFRLMKDFDQMLWYIHNGGKLPSILNSAHMLVGPKPLGGKSELNTKGMILLAALKEAEFDRGKTCNCSSNMVNVNDDDVEDETRGFIKTSELLKNGTKIEFENEGRLRNYSESGSMSCLLLRSESSEVSNDFEERTIEISDSMDMFPRVTDLDLLQENDLPPVLVVDSGVTVKPSGFSVQELSL